jgi:serine protease
MGGLLEHAFGVARRGSLALAAARDTQGELARARQATLVLLVAAFVAATTLALPGGAWAAAQTYCVHQTGTCPVSQVDEGADLQTALNLAASHSGSTVSIGAGTFTRAGGFQFSSPSDVAISGAGAGQTIIQATAPASNVFTVNSSATSTLSGVNIDVTSGVLNGLALAGAVASGIAVTVEPGALTSGVGAHVIGGLAKIDSSTIQGAQTAIEDETSGGFLGLSGDTLSAVGGLGALNATVVAQDLRINASGVAVDANGEKAEVTVDGLLVVIAGSASIANAVTAVNGSSMTVRSATIVDADNSNDIGVASYGNEDETSLTVSDSIVWGFPVADRRSAIGLGATASLTLNNDDIHLAPASPDAGKYIHNNDIDVDPLFVSPAIGDYHLRFGSPAIDAGGACHETCETVPDLDGLTRPIDGNGDGIAVRDMGAFEYGHRSPLAAAAATPGAAVTGDPVTFSAAGSSDPDPGDTLSYAWTLDDGATATGVTVSHAFATPGVHIATVTVTDPSGLAASATTRATITSPPSPALLKDTTPPTVSSLELSPSKFAVAKGPTATLAGAKPKSPHRGTKIKFKLSEPARVAIAFARKTTGIKLGKACVAPGRKHRHGKSCTRYVRAGSLTRRTESAGADSISFTGRLGHAALAHGQYRLTLIATDPLGNVSRPATASFTVLGR